MAGSNIMNIFKAFDMCGQIPLWKVCLFTYHKQKWQERHLILEEKELYLKEQKQNRAVKKGISSLSRK